MFTICLQIVHTLLTTDLYNVLKDKGKGYLKRVPKVYSMKQYIKLNNETFEVKKVKGELYPIREVRGLGDCYNNPSRTKYEIYHAWLKWYKVTNMNEPFYRLRHFTINRYNCMMFTLLIDVYDFSTDKFIGQLYITKTRQEFWTV